MLNRLPNWTPSLAEMLPELGRPSAKAIGKAFGVTERTAKGWIKNGAPRAVLLSMYWLTGHGQKILDVDLYNYAQNHIGLSRARERQIVELEKQVQHLAAIADFGSANDPAPNIVSGNCFDVTVTLTTDPGLRPTMTRPSCERQRLS